MRKKVQITFVSIFLCIIIFPVLYINKIENKIAPGENRYVSKFPQIFDSKTGKLNNKLNSELESWLNDNIGFRDKFVVLNDVINYNIFRELTNKDVIIGNEEWLYLMYPGNIERIQHKNILTEEEIKNYNIKFGKISSFFRSKGTPFIINVFPYKTDIYPEYLPNYFIETNKKSLIDTMKKNFENQKEFDFFVLDEAIKNYKEKSLIYSKAYDTSHWNNLGAFIGYRELMNGVKKYIPNIKILDFDDFNIEEINRETFVAGRLFTNEKDYDFKLKNGTSVKEDKEFFNKINFSSKDPWKSYRCFHNKNVNLPKAIIVGDSYVWMFMLEYMSESFSQLVFIHQADMSNLTSIYDEIRPDIIVGAGLDVTMLGLSEIPLEDLNAMIISENTPKEISLSDSSDIDIIIKNTGQSIWNEENGIRLGIWKDGIDYGYRIYIQGNVYPGDEYTFTLENIADIISNDSLLEYQMLSEGVTWFGEKSRIEIKLKK